MVVGRTYALLRLLVAEHRIQRSKFSMNYAPSLLHPERMCCILNQNSAIHNVSLILGCSVGGVYLMETRYSVGAVGENELSHRRYGPQSTPIPTSYLMTFIDILICPYIDPQRPGLEAQLPSLYQLTPSPLPYISPNVALSKSLLALLTIGLWTRQRCYTIA